jgi:hypothetical protein
MTQIASRCSRRSSRRVRVADGREVTDYLTLMGDYEKRVWPRIPYKPPRPDSRVQRQGSAARLLISMPVWRVVDPYQRSRIPAQVSFAGIHERTICLRQYPSQTVLELVFLFLFWTFALVSFAFHPRFIRNSSPLVRLLLRGLGGGAQDFPSLRRSPLFYQPNCLV